MGETNTEEPQQEQPPQEQELPPDRPGYEVQEVISLPSCNIKLSPRVSFHVLPVSSSDDTLELENTYLLDWIEKERSETRVVLYNRGSGLSDTLLRGASLRGLSQCDVLHIEDAPYMNDISPVNTYVFFKVSPRIIREEYFLNTIMKQFNNSETTRMVFMGDTSGYGFITKALDDAFYPYKTLAKYQRNAVPGGDA